MQLEVTFPSGTPDTSDFPLWERVDKYYDTCRLTVPGGWLYRYVGAQGVAMVFVPNPVSDPKWFAGPDHNRKVEVVVDGKVVGRQG